MATQSPPIKTRLTNRISAQKTTYPKARESIPTDQAFPLRRITRCVSQSWMIGPTPLRERSQRCSLGDPR